jgi:hypothetical protein
MAEKTQQVGGQMRYTEEEINIMRATFHGNEKLVKLLRKVFLPTLDPEAPLGQMVDLWMTLPVTHETPAEDVKVAVIARNQIIAHVEGRLMELTVLSQAIKSPEEVTAGLKKDSTK